MRSFWAAFFLFLTVIPMTEANAFFFRRARARRTAFMNMGGMRSRPPCVNCAVDQLGAVGAPLIAPNDPSFVTAAAPAAAPAAFGDNARTRDIAGAPDLHEAPAADPSPELGGRPIADATTKVHPVSKTTPDTAEKKVTADATPAFKKIEAMIQHQPYIDWLNNIINKRNPGYGDLNALIKKWHASHPGLTLDQMALTLAVLEEGGASSALGTLDPAICAKSDPYALSDARAGRQQGHAGFNERFQSLVAAGARTASEIEAESWPTQMLGDDLMVHARDCVKSWKGSPGHYADMMKYHKRFCYSMARGNNGTHYCIGLFAD